MGDPCGRRKSSPPARRVRKSGIDAFVSASTVQDEFAGLSIRKRKGHADNLCKTEPSTARAYRQRGRGPTAQDTRKRLKAVAQEGAHQVNHRATGSATQSAQVASPFHALPIELIWRVLDELRGDTDDTAQTEVQRIGSMRSTCRLFAFAGLPKLYESRRMRIRRDSGGPLDLTRLESLCEKLSPGDIERFDLLYDQDAVTNRIDLAETASRLGQNTQSILQHVRVFVLGHQPVKYRQEQDASPTSDKENTIVKVRDIADEHADYLGQVATMLGAMSKLQSLTMSSVLHWDVLMPAPGCGPGMLQDLALVECEVSQQALQRLLGANQRSLRRLTLARLWMQDRAEVKELMATVKGLLNLDEFVFVSRRPALSRPPSWQGHREALKEIFGRGSQELPRKAEFAWVKP